ncbi:MAG: zinc ABC transporter permease [Bacteroidetes bacterium]|nr:MAG: zinc ABC transporter permease [Bacteroidota bacterium]
MLQNLLDFLSFQDINVRYVTFGSVLLAACSAVVGCFTFLKKKALVGDAVAHSVLPGVCLAFLATGTKNPVFLVVGAFLTGWISLIVIDWITANTKLKEDTAIGLVLSVFFGIGILLLTAIQHSGNASQAGLDSFLFGKAAALVGNDLIVFSTLAVVLLAVIFLFFKEFTLISFDLNFAKVIGYPVRKLELLLTTLTVLAVVVGIQAVGVVLMAAMLITPATAARFWTDKLPVMVLIAALMGAFSGFMGALVSYLSPSMPTGPWVVLVLSIVALFSFMFAPKKGILARMMLQRSNQRKICDENILKAMYQIGETDKDFFAERKFELIQEKRLFQTKYLKKGLNRLKREGYLQKKNNFWKFTKEGFEKGKRVTKLHRLWELYLTEYLRIAIDHVHDDAETMEHIITPEIEERLEQRLHYPTVDPHNTQIPK